MILLNIIILLLIAHLFVQFLFKPSPNTLNCGLFGWSSTNKNNWTPLNKFKFEVLGMQMDTRGGDGCGIAYDNVVDKSSVIKLFDDFWRAGRVPDELQHPSILGHDRKASVGDKTYENTQPIFFQFKDKTAVFSILAHNGTLFNHKALYEKHKLEVHYDETDVKNMSDSQVLALLIERVGWSILEEYTGTAAILYQTAKEPGVMYMYHGRSAIRGAVVASEERPLYYAIDGDDFWVCSTKTALGTIIQDVKTIVEVPFNEVFRVRGNTVESVVKIDRSKATQMEEWTASSNVNRNWSCNRHEDDEWDYETCSWVPKKPKAIGFQSGGAGSTVTRQVVVPITLLTKDEAVGKSVNRIYWEAGLWRRIVTFGKETEVLHGPLTIGIGGEIMKFGTESHGQTKHIYFWAGNLCQNREAYIRCIELVDRFKDIVSEKVLYTIIGGNFAYPFIIPDIYGGDDNKVYNNNLSYSKKINGESVDVYDYNWTGQITPIGRSVTFNFIRGELKNSTVGSYTSYSAFEEYSDKYPDEFLEWQHTYMEDSKANAKESEEENPEDMLFECPDCDGTGYFGTKKCPTCNGTCEIDFETLQKLLERFERDIEFLPVFSEELKYRESLLKIVTRGIEVLEEPDLVSKSRGMLDKLIKIKNVIEE